jgi:hypothetical protein
MSPLVPNQLVEGVLAFALKGLKPLMTVAHLNAGT